MNKKLFQPQVEAVAALPWSKYKKLGQAAGAWNAASYTLHRCHLARHTSDSEWVPLWSQMMAKIAGNAKNWGTLWKLLVSERFLECDGKFSHGTKSLSFRLGSALAGANWKLSADPFPLPEIAPRAVWKGLSINATEAHKILEAIASARGWDRERLEAWHYRVAEFSPGFTTGRTGRQFGDANLLPSEVRDALTIFGKPTAEVDISNSQPLFLATLYPPASKERSRYLALVERGEIYQFFGKLLGTDREGAKARFAPWLFGARDDLFAALFANQFPELAQVIGGIRDKHYKALAFDLQRKEAEVILDACEKFEGVSIHDGIRVIEDREEDVKLHIAKTLKERHGLAVQFK
ncbi:hypothetical protein [Haloferula sp. BvORR071]|uniref:hypothetical protein n=1 Tax=Haloferula sp. BvORR071 TaxID=1396141 RepID=UPI00054EA24F|nr:hypothetical protein [Haloferula sp. BvORR071]